MIQDRPTQRAASEPGHARAGLVNTAKVLHVHGIGAAITEHPLVPPLTGETVGFPARRRRTLLERRGVEKFSFWRLVLYW